MKYKLKINLYTDGDFGFDYVPTGTVRYECGPEYIYEYEYDDRKSAIENTKRICNFFRENIRTNDSKIYVKYNIRECIDTFLERIMEFEGSDKNIHVNIHEYVHGNYDGTEFSFESTDDYISCGFYVSDEEQEIITKNIHLVSNDMIKEAVLNVFREAQNKK